MSKKKEDSSKKPMNMDEVFKMMDVMIHKDKEADFRVFPEEVEEDEEETELTESEQEIYEYGYRDGFLDACSNMQNFILRMLVGDSAYDEEDDEDNEDE